MRKLWHRHDTAPALKLHIRRGTVRVSPTSAAEPLVLSPRQWLQYESAQMWSLRRILGRLVIRRRDLEHVQQHTDEESRQRYKISILQSWLRVRRLCWLQKMIHNPSR